KRKEHIVRRFQGASWRLHPRNRSESANCEAARRRVRGRLSATRRAVCNDNGKRRRRKTERSKAQAINGRRQSYSPAAVRAPCRIRSDVEIVSHHESLAAHQEPGGVDLASNSKDSLQRKDRRRPKGPGLAGKTSRGIFRCIHLG